MDQLKVAATYMRGGTSKGIFFRADSLPIDPVLRDRLLMRVMGSPDPYAQQIDGMGAATSSTSKVMVVSASALPDCDVDYMFGQVAIDRALVDWSGNCGNLTSAVAPFAIAQELIHVAAEGIACVRMRHLSTNTRIHVHVPMKNGKVIEDGDFELDGVTFPAAEIRVEFLYEGQNANEEKSPGKMFPTEHPADVLEVPGVGHLHVTMIVAGNPTVFAHAAQLGLRGDELQKDVNTNAALLAKLEMVRAHAAVRMGLAASTEEASLVRLHTPKLTLIAPPSAFAASSGKTVEASMIDLNARIISMGKLHHAMTGTGAIAIGVAAAIPGTIIHDLLGGSTDRVRFGHPSGVMVSGAEVASEGGFWVVRKAVMSRSARRLMEGSVFVPASVYERSISDGDLHG